LRITTVKPFPIPVVGEVEVEEELTFLAMSREVPTFEMPRVPEASADRDVAGARDVLHAFVGLLGDWLARGSDDPVMELAGLDGGTLRVLNETLGEGEVAAVVRVDGHEVRVQETVFPGVWRQQRFTEAGRLCHDLLLAAPLPPVLLTMAQLLASPTLRTLPLPEVAMNVPSLIHEIQEAMDRCGPGVPPHVVNLTLLPLSVEDSAHLDAVLDGGGVVILSRGFGNCRISSTAARHVWRVQYFNNMQTLILNTLEVVELPEVAVAAQEDLEASLERLAELLAWMSDSLQSA
jgi:hydrogenase-1 operon protein HyaF